MIHYPNAAVQHTWFVPEKDWKLMRTVVEELQPEYGKCFDEVFNAPEFYNYNMLVAKNRYLLTTVRGFIQFWTGLKSCQNPRGARGMTVIRLI